MSYNRDVKKFLNSKKFYIILELFFVKTKFYKFFVSSNTKYGLVDLVSTNAIKVFPVLLFYVNKIIIKSIVWFYDASVLQT